MKKVGIGLGVLSVCLLMVLGITTGKQITSSEQKKESIQIGLSVDSFVLERWQRDRDVFIAQAEALGAQVDVQDAGGDVARQIEQIEQFIEKKVDVITIIAIDSDALTEVVKKAKKEGIIVIGYDRLIKNANIDLYISFDNKKIGSLMAESLLANIEEPKGKILMICGPPTDNNVYLMNEGFEEVMANYPQYTIEKDYAEQWVAEKARIVTNEQLGQSEAIHGIMCGNDGLAREAISALAEKRLAGKVKVVGQDADLEACQRVVEGTQAMTVYKSVDELAKKAATYAVALAKDEAIQVEEQFWDGKYEVPYVCLQPIAVTQENIDEVIIQSGFHTREDVYLNLPQD